jgi:hypothetical protein
VLCKKRQTLMYSAPLHRKYTAARSSVCECVVEYYIIHYDTYIQSYRVYRKREGGRETAPAVIISVCNQDGATRRSHVMTLDVLRRSFFFYLDAVKRYTGNDTTRMRPEFSVQMLWPLFPTNAKLLGFIQRHSNDKELSVASYHHLCAYKRILRGFYSVSFGLKWIICGLRANFYFWNELLDAELIPIHFRRYRERVRSPLRLVPIFIIFT